MDGALKRFWEIEEIPEKPQSLPDDLECERPFKEGQRRDDTGRYIVHLPLRIHGPLPLKGSLSATKRSLERMYERMSVDPEEYYKFMQDYEDLHHEMDWRRWNCLSSWAGCLSSPPWHLAARRLIGKTPCGLQRIPRCWRRSISQ